MCRYAQKLRKATEPIANLPEHMSKMGEVMTVTYGT